jgi:DNA-binding MarR family transcriptional regulator
LSLIKHNSKINFTLGTELSADSLVSYFMSLEEKIKQTKFKSPEHKLGLNLLFSSHQIQYLLHQNFRDKEITHQQYNVLRILRGQYPNPCNLKLIKERMLDPMSDASRIIDKLIKKEFVQRKESKKDRRNVDLLISNKGLKLLESLDYLDDTFKDLFDKLSAEEVEQLNNLFDKMQS